MQALTLPLLATGVRSVLATQWLIGDAGTVPVVRELYAQLARRQTVAGALRAAREAMWRSGRPPRDWAAFVAVGDGTATLPVNRPLGWLVWVGASSGLAVLGVLAWVQRRGRGAR